MRRIRDVFVIALFSLGFFSGFGAPPLYSAEQAPWSYSGIRGPEHWGSLKKEYAICKKGHRQSPIDLDSSKVKNTGDSLRFNYREAPFVIVDNGHTIQASFKNAGRITLDGELYHLVQLHFHAPSEHAINGRQYPIEMHLVHQNDKGVVVVVGVFIKEGEHNPALEKIFSRFPEEKNKDVDSDGVVLYPKQLLPENLDFYEYLGSFTTPPCTEGVHWIVLTDPIEASREQIAAFRRIYPGNSRPFQKPFQRIVESGHAVY